MGKPKIVSGVEVCRGASLRSDWEGRTISLEGGVDIRTTGGIICWVGRWETNLCDDAGDGRRVAGRL